MFSGQQYSRVSTNEKNVVINIPSCGDTDTDTDLELQTKMKKINDKTVKPDEYIIGISGSRAKLSPEARKAFNDYLDNNKVIGMHTDDSIGIAADVHKIAKGRGIVSIIHPPDNTRLTRAFCDGDIILCEKYHGDIYRDIVNASQLLIVFPFNKNVSIFGSKVQNTINYARKQHKPIIFIYHDGTMKRENNIEKKKFSY